MRLSVNCAGEIVAGIMDSARTKKATELKLQLVEILDRMAANYDISIDSEQGDELSVKELEAALTNSGRFTITFFNLFPAWSARELRKAFRNQNLEHRRSLTDLIEDLKSLVYWIERNWNLPESCFVVTDSKRKILGEVQELLERVEDASDPLLQDVGRMILKTTIDNELVEKIESEPQIHELFVCLSKLEKGSWIRFWTRHYDHRHIQVFCNSI